MKKIALTPRLIENDSYFEIREALDVRWGALFKKLNFLPIFLPIEVNFESYFNAFPIDGIILTGGNDLSVFQENEVSKKRDIFEMNLIDYAIKKRIPLLGVCRGMQIIAHYFGASFKKVENQVGVHHQLSVSSDSRYKNQLEKMGEVNSFHNFAVDKIDSSIISISATYNGIIKAIEHKSYPIFAQMWHSEREDPFKKAELEFFQDFFISRNHPENHP